MSNKLLLATKEIKDPVIRRNFENLNKFLDSDVPFLKFQHLEISADAAATDVKVAHNLGYIPKDIVRSKVVGTGKITFNYAMFDVNYLYYTATGPVRFRGFIGTFEQDSSRINDTDLEVEDFFATTEVTKNIGVTKTTGDYTVVTGDEFILATVEGTSTTLTLPPAKDNNERELVIQKEDASLIGILITCDLDANDFFKTGERTILLYAKNDKLRLLCDGETWIVIERPEETVFLKDVKATTVVGGTFTTGWQTRTLNTLEDNYDLPWIALSTNQFTLDPGTYDFEASSPGYRVDSHQARLRNVSDGLTTLIGTTERCDAADSVQTRSFIRGTISIAAKKTFELQHYAASTHATNGFGQASSSGESEIYAQARITRRRP